MHHTFDYIDHFIWIFSVYLPCSFSWTSSNYCTCQNLYHNKRVNLQTIHHYENFILDNKTSLAFHFGNSNYIHNEIQVIQGVSSQANYFYSTFYRTFIYFHYHCSLCILVPLCSIKVEGDDKQKTW